ncbi:hypothetical protein PHYBLDRAFT_107388 [Phycomyces blakesleeanus NRRL 1555(-)]|uniref:Protein yippee-like n=1 Tax=Phycomyces blakesleeanus (strain ATCC 8743b / DSM 1359 / FGSC 10004 / NBRC 33097 / NRRL 1555) TaxID=763407 RepID=A0A162UWV2_PHYB8|nr:hypothetical protein PHYBLDRAFT_107388 [Phycomyces blakesleeanus NRRL 1555(-)]OAD78502.1 hypothetical protein PHYBLDRAFT_107388 [Phycomyces blakesleeanus NRRL 1555(-)]|eukprot:XP_018296542.1 hypothetical protein PHYBLDRAFT_107388 [Phycomyces blakesleeanus NRRL 1555(-)]
MGLKYREYLEGRRIYGCSKCRSHLTTGDRILSKGFRGNNGEAYLIHNVVNVSETGEEHESIMTTGRHKIIHISCVRCGSQLGWKYTEAHDEEQKYKEGKYILERNLIRIVK